MYLLAADDFSSNVRSSFNNVIREVITDVGKSDQKITVWI